MKTILKTNKKLFSIGQIIPLEGLEGEIIIVSENRIAAISAAEAAILNGSQIKKIELPYVTVQHACWSADGNKIFIGNGIIDIDSGKWVPDPKLSEFIKTNASGSVNTRLKTISWNKEGTFATVLLDWTELDNQETASVKLLVFDLKSDAPPIIIPETQISDVRIVGNHIVILANEVSVWNFTGEEVARLPATGSPYRISVNENEDCFALLDNDWKARIVETRNWKIKAIWNGYFRDIIITKEGLIAVDLEGRLHAACLSNGQFKPVGTVATNLSASQIVSTGDDWIIIMGMDSVSVHSVTYNLNCTNKN